MGKFENYHLGSRSQDLAGYTHLRRRPIPILVGRLILGIANGRKSDPDLRSVQSNKRDYAKILIN